ncbi:Uncharacterized protein PBTT_10501 [Plasmodiophora brassicae]
MASSGPGDSGSTANEILEGDDRVHVTLDVIVKPYVSIQPRNTLYHVLGQFDVEVATVGDFTDAVLGLVQENVDGLARKSSDDDSTYILAKETVTLTSLDQFVAIKHNNHFYAFHRPHGEDHRDPMRTPTVVLTFKLKLVTECCSWHTGITKDTLNRWSKDVPSLFIYQYGKELRNASDFKKFQASVFSAPQLDRARAAADEQVRAIERQLKDHWGTVYQSQSANWRIWASRIAREPVTRRAALIEDPPPYEIVHLFEHSPLQNGPLLTTLREDNSTTLAILDTMDDHLQEFQDFIHRQIEAFRDSVGCQMRQMRDTVRRHRRVAEALRASLHPEELPDNLNRLQRAPNQSDVDHEDQ